MRATSASCLPGSPERRAPMAGSRGFTLLELLVVLVLLGLVTGLVAPLAVNGLNAARERAVMVELRALLEGLPVRAFGAGQAQAHDERALTSLLGELPVGWSLKLDAPLQYSVSGVASGGDLSLLAPGRAPVRWHVVAVSGEVREQRLRP